MKNHFDNIRSMINEYKGEFFYEQSFLNVYFNKNNKTNRIVISNDNYKMHPIPHVNYEGKLVHFCGGPGNALNKYTLMTRYIWKYMPFIK
jgi:hypothetical protein